MFSTDFIFRQQENFVDNQICQAGVRPLCNKILLNSLSLKVYLSIPFDKLHCRRPNSPFYVGNEFSQVIKATIWAISPLSQIIVCSCSFAHFAKLLRWSHYGLLLFCFFFKWTPLVSWNDKVGMELLGSIYIMAIRVVEFSNGGYKVRKVFA